MSAEISRNGSDAYAKADNRVGFRWITPRRSLTPTALAAGLINSTALLETGIVTKYPIPTAVASSVIYIASAIADHKSTVSAATAMQLAEENGIKGRHSERNIFARGETQPEALRKNKKMLLADIGVSVVSLIPFLGIPIALSKFRIALSNKRIEKVYNRAIEIIKNDDS